MRKKFVPDEEKACECSYDRRSNTAIPRTENYGVKKSNVRISILPNHGSEQNSNDDAYGRDQECQKVSLAVVKQQVQPWAGVVHIDNSGLEEMSSADADEPPSGLRAYHMRPKWSV